MDLLQLLGERRDEIVADAHDALQRAHLKHYEASGPEASEERLARLYDLAVECLRTRSLVPIVSHAERVARERFEAGYDFREVHAAFNALEEALWRRIVADVPAERQAEALGLTGTVLGAGKEALAAEYVAQASHRHAPTLDLTHLFEGG